MKIGNNRIHQNSNNECKPLGLYSLRRRRLISIGIPIINLRRSSDRLRFVMGIPIPVRRRLLSEKRPWVKKAQIITFYSWQGLVIYSIINAMLTQSQLITESHGVTRVDNGIPRARPARYLTMAPDRGLHGQLHVEYIPYDMHTNFLIFFSIIQILNLLPWDYEIRYQWIYPHPSWLLHQHTDKTFCKIWIDIHLLNVSNDWPSAYGVTMKDTSK